MEEKEDVNTIVSQQVQFTGIRRQLLEVLQKLGMDVANIYEGAINVLQASNIPNRINLSAHALRELIDKLPECSNAPKIKQSSSLGNLARNFRNDWLAFNKKFNNWLLIDNWTKKEGLAVRKILQKCQSFISAAQDILPTKEKKLKNKLKMLLEYSNLNPVPLRKEQELIEVLKKCHTCFSEVAHHAPAESDLFIEKLNQLEYVLRVNFPTTFKNREDLLKLIKEAEGE